MDKQALQFEDLVWKYLDGESSEHEFNELQQFLSENAEYRKRYQHLVEVHLSLSNRSKNAEANSEPITPLFTNQSNAYQASRKPLVFSGLAGVAAMLCLSLFGYALITDRSQSIQVEYIAARDADIRGTNISVGDYATTQMTHLMSGAVALSFPSNTKAIIEGPAFYQVQNNGSIMVASGTITVDHQGEPGTFKIITPLGELIDMGTKFGVKIGNGVTDSMVMTEVYEGEVVYKNDQQNQMSMTEGQAFAILGNNNAKDVVTEINGESVRVSGTFDLPNRKHGLKRVENLALGKPVTASSYYNRQGNGEVFGPQSLTDNRLADSGSPWDWSFWLAKNNESGTVTVDLLKPYMISRVDLQNTRNRQYNDRGIKDFIIEVSTDNIHYTQVTQGSLKRIKWHDAKSYDFEVFQFRSISAQYVRIKALSNYAPEDARHQGSGGLNEIRIFE